MRLSMASAWFDFPGFELIKFGNFEPTRFALTLMEDLRKRVLLFGKQDNLP